MRAALSVAIGLAIGAALALPVLVPGTFEAMTMLSRDERGEAAVAVGNRARRQGDADPGLLGKLIDLNRQFGDPDAERSAIEDYLHKYPKDLVVLRKAEAFYEHMQDLSAWIGVLERIVALDENPADIEKLARIYRLWGEFGAERKLLVAHRQVKLSPPIALRLAEYLARDNELAQATEVLKQVVDRPANHRRQARTLLFDVLVRRGQAQEAAKRAANWVKTGLEPSQQSIFVLTLAVAGADTAARELAGALPSQAFGSSSLAWMLGSKGRVDLAREVVHRWQKGARPETVLKATRLYVDIAGSLNSLDLVYRDLEEGLRGEDEAEAARSTTLARVLYEKYGYTAIAGVRSRLTARRLVNEPIFAASLANAEQNPSATRYFLLRADLANVDEDEADRWTSLASIAFTAIELADELAVRWQAGNLSPALFATFQKTAVRAGRPDPAFAALDAMSAASFRPPKDGSLG